MIVGIVHTSNCLRGLTSEERAPVESVWRDRFLPKGVDLLELRLDALAPFSMSRAWPLPVIATARDPAEGGLNNLSLSQRQQLLEASLPSVAAIDIELRSAKKLASTIQRVKEAERELILSLHNFQTVFSLRELNDLTSRAYDAGATLLKVVTITASQQDLEDLIEFQQLSHPLPVATMGIGPLGKISRLRLAEVGSALTYGWIDKPLETVPPSMQWSAAELVLHRAKIGSVKADF